MTKSVNVLLVEHRRADALLVRDALSDISEATFNVDVCVSLLEALTALAGSRPDIIITDLNLPDSLGLRTFEQLHQATPTTPVLIMTTQTDHAVGVSAVSAGAQDYLVKGEIGSRSLARLVLQAIARHKLRLDMARQLHDDQAAMTRLRNLVDVNLDSMLVMRPDGGIIFRNRRAEEMFGPATSQLAEQLVGRPQPDENGRVVMFTDPQARSRQLLMRTQPTVWDGAQAYLVLLSQTGQSTGDGLGNTLDNVTGLFSRQSFYEQARLCLEQARKNDLAPAMLCINLDNFRRINEALGHVCGDELLRLVGERIRRQVRAGDLVGRFSGDEFLVLLASLRQSLDADHVASKIMRALAEPIDLWDSDLRISARAGVVLFPQDGQCVEDLVRHAQVAGQRAKLDAGHPIHYYTRDLTQRSEKRLYLEQQLRRALAKEQFEILYQPVVAVTSGRILSVEALLRWRVASSAVISPAEFVPVLEETGLINEVGAWVLRKASAQVQHWRKLGLDLRLAVNISAKQFENPALLQLVNTTLADTGLPARALCLELTETVLMRNIEASSATLKSLRSSGVTVAIDDFGTGFSSLNYLKRFAIDTLKIDRSFIRDVCLGGHDAAITHATIDLAHNLGLQVIAEGVEKVEQLTFLEAHGCDAYQGYYFSRPTTAASIVELHKNFAG